MAELERKIQVGPTPCVFDGCEMTLDIGICAVSRREDSGNYTLEITPEPNAMKNALIHHLVTVHPDDTVELDDGDRKVMDMTDEDWDEMFSGDDEVEVKN